MKLLYIDNEPIIYEGTSIHCKTHIKEPEPFGGVAGLLCDSHTPVMFIRADP